jgi:predicted SAM-dependent methyltransferase
MKAPSGEYALKGNYHLDLDQDWPYRLVYLEKMRIVEKILFRFGPTDRVIDLGCGEGVLVQKYRQHGWNIIGLDANYESEFVIRGNLLTTQFPSASFDLILCLDVLEHLIFADQEKAVKEITRILRPGGTLILGLPNLAHFASRLSFLVKGRLLRTSGIERHPGDRPIEEYLRLIAPYYSVVERHGIFPTFLLISLLTIWKPAKSMFLHRIYNRLWAYPNWCFLNLLLCVRKTDR